MRPIIGIIAATESARWGAWDLPACLVPLSYVAHIEAAAGRALLVPPHTNDVETTLGVLDGLMLTGGADIDPERYGAAAHDKTRPAHPDRDEAELLLLEPALECDLPVLAICRGMEVLNVLRGGELDQHVPDSVGHEGHREVRGVFSEHEVRLEPTSLTGSALGGRSTVKSHHHQAVSRLGGGLIAVGWSDDGVIEALEDPARRFAVGVQWHPEAGADDRLFTRFVESARASRAERLRTAEASA